jgi:PAS domain S-box-containing protein
MTELFHQQVQAGLLGRAVDAAPAAVFVTDEHGGFVAANRYVCHMLGREREELLSTRLADVVWGAEPLPKPDEGSTVGIAQLRHSDGSKVIVRYQVRALNGGDSPFAVWLATPRNGGRSTSIDARSPRARAVHGPRAQVRRAVRGRAPGLRLHPASSRVHSGLDTHV